MMLQPEPSRVIGGETASRMAARRVILPGWGRLSNFTEDACMHAAEQDLAEEEALKAGMAERNKEFMYAGAEDCAKA